MTTTPPTRKFERAVDAISSEIAHSRHAGQASSPLRVEQDNALR